MQKAALGSRGMLQGVNSHQSARSLADESPGALLQPRRGGLQLLWLLQGNLCPWVPSAPVWFFKAEVPVSVSSRQRALKETSNGSLQITISHGLHV